jgi:hypothetical protein
VYHTLPRAPFYFSGDCPNRAIGGGNENEVGHVSYSLIVPDGVATTDGLS